VIHESSGIAATFVAYDLLTSLDIYLWGCIRKIHRQETKPLNIVNDAVVMWNSQENAWQLIRALLKQVCWYTASAGRHLEQPAAWHFMSQPD
jgi:hypothetical protein